MPEITTTRVNQTVYRAAILEAELKSLAVAAVAAKAGLDVMSSHIETRATVTSRQEGSLGDRRVVIEVELIDRHGDRPSVGMECPADGSLSAPIVGDGSGLALPEIQG
jgi:hypothetical protein